MSGSHVSSASASASPSDAASRPFDETPADQRGAAGDGGGRVQPPDAGPTGFLGRHRQTVGLWVLAVLFAVACVGLGRWQLHRYQDKHAKSQLVQRNYGAPPVPLGQLQPSPDAPFDPQQQWRRVVATGRYDAARTVLVRNRPHNAGSSDPTYGYEVLVPLRLQDGSTLLVDRGWLPSGSHGTNPAQAPDAVPAPPSGDVRVVVRLRAGEPARDRPLPPGQVSSISLPRVAALTGLRLRPGYGALASETPASATAPARLDPPDLGSNEGINASYAVQWVVFALLGLGFPIWLRRRQREAAAEDAAAAAGLHTGGATDASSRSSGKPRRRRIWDADDEDDDAVPD